MKKSGLFRFASLVLAVIMLLGLLPAMGVFAADETITAIEKEEGTFRLAVVSDSHLAYNASKTNNLDKALGYFKTIGGVDAIAMNGDMTYAPAVSSTASYEKYNYNGTEVNIPAGLYNPLKTVIENDGYFTLAGTQNGDEFTADTSDGKMPIIYSMGNHEYPENDRSTDSTAAATRADASRQLFTDETGRAANHIMKVDGYTFIATSAKDFFNDYRDVEEFVKNQILAAEEADPTSNKPIFYLQHEGIFGTVSGTDSTATGNSESFKAFLNEHPRVIVLSAHAHRIERDPRTIWQDGFTAISTAQLGGGSLNTDGLSRKFSSASSLNNGSQCLMFDLKNDNNETEVKIYRIDVKTGKMIGDPYVFTVDGTKNDTYRYGTKNATKDIISKASYQEGAKLHVTSEGREDFSLTIHTELDTTGEYSVPAVIPGTADYLQDNFIHSYRVVVENIDGGTVVQNFRIYGDYFEPVEDRVKTYATGLSSQLDRDTNYKISLYPLTPFMVSCTVDELKAMEGVYPATHTFKTSAEVTQNDLALIRTYKNVNVALNKKVVAGNPNHTEQVAAKLVNGKYTSEYVHANSDAGAGSYTPGTIVLPSGATTSSATHQKNDWFIIDLGRRYDISEVKVWSRRDSAYKAIFMQYFDIQASNTEDFAKYVTLGGVTTNTPADNTTPVTVSGDGNAYRYIRLQRTGNSAYGYSEIEVFADVTTQEISRNRQAEVSFQTYSNMGASHTVDGTLTNSSKVWLIESLKSSDPQAPFNLVVDLEKDYPVGMIEMYGRYSVAAEAYRKNWKIYGYTNEQGKPDVNKTDFSDGVQLWHVDNPYPQITNSTNPEGLKAPITGDQKYRYIVFSKTVREVAAIGEVRADVVLPKISSVARINDTTLKVSFTEKMDEASLGEGITVTNGTAVYTPSSVALESAATNWDGGYDAVVTFENALPTAGLKLNVAGSVKTASGVSFVQDASVYIEGKTVTINKAYSEKVTDVNVAFNKPVYSAVEGANGALLTNGLGNTKDALGGLTYPATAPQIELPSGDKVAGATNTGDDWYIVDLGQRYNVKKIRLYYSTINGELPRYLYYTKIMGSNSITFDNAKQLGKIDWNDTRIQDGYFEIILDGTQPYRYIKVQKTGKSEYYYKELEVYADVMTTEVSRNASVTVDSDYTNAFGSAAGVKAKVTDGNTAYEYGGVLFEGVVSSIAPPYNVLVDLGSEYPIGMIQMWGRGNENGSFASKTTYRQNWTVYGSTSANAPASAQDTTKAVNLLSVGSTAYPASGLKGAVNVGNYRYLTFSKTAKEVGCIGEIRASVLNPEILKVTKSAGNRVAIMFSDKLDPASVSADDFTIDGVDITDISFNADGWDGAYEVVLSYNGEIKEGAVLTTSATLRSQNGIEMAAAGTYTFETVSNKTLKTGGAVAESLATDTVYTFTGSYNGAANATGAVYITLKKKVGDDVNVAKLECVKMSTFTADANGYAALTASIDTTDIDVTDCWIEVFVWDNTLTPITNTFTFGK